MGAELEGMDEATFCKEVTSKIAPVLEAWDSCVRGHIDHEDSQTCWMRPAFCECKPWYGIFKLTDIGHAPKHRLRAE